MSEYPITGRGVLLRIAMAAVFFAAAGAGAFLAFGPVSADRSPREISANAEPIIEAKKDRLFMIAVGDMMLDRNVLSLTMKDGKYDYPFRKIDGYLDRADIRIGNLEGPVTGNTSEAIKTNGMRFTFPTDYLSALAERFDVLLIGNNHALDFGEEGLRETKNNLSRKGITFFGVYLKRRDNNSAVIKKNGIKIGFVGYHSLVGQGYANVILDISKLDALCDLVIAVPHWGDEYEMMQNAAQEKAAREMIDAGADVVIGGHPHVTQPISAYKGKAIFWSLGNFVFDQYFSEETMKSISVTLDIERSVAGEVGVKYGVIPIEIGRDSQPEIMDDGAAKEFLNDLALRSDVSEAGKEDIRSGKFNPLFAEKD
jgi:poly-gamma-glutamate synthesis protein (capsule biosynthesis protein)